ncbi:MAG: hypothetical protein R6V08_06955 [Desulfuromonadales bacterium]
MITGVDSMAVLNQALKAGRTFTPFTQEQVAALLDHIRTAAVNGRYELFKITAVFDATARNPHWPGKLEGNAVLDT